MAPAVGVVEISALGPRPTAVESDRPQQAHELRVDRPRVEVELLAPMLVEQLAQGHALRVNPLARGAQATALAARAQGEDLGKDRDCSLSRRPGSEVEACRPLEPLALVPPNTR